MSFDPMDLIIFGAGFALLLKKFADMDRYQTLRVIVLTAILGSIVTYIVLTTFTPRLSHDCVIVFDQSPSNSTPSY